MCYFGDCARQNGITLWNLGPLQALIHYYLVVLRHCSCYVCLYLYFLQQDFSLYNVKYLFCMFIPSLDWTKAVVHRPTLLGATPDVVSCGNKYCLNLISFYPRQKWGKEWKKETIPCVLMVQFMVQGLQDVRLFFNITCSIWFKAEK